LAVAFFFRKRAPHFEKKVSRRRNVPKKKSLKKGGAIERL
jgi:hypothetical protein